MKKGKELVATNLPQDIHECKTIEEILEWSYQNMRPIYGITPKTVRLVLDDIPRFAASEQAVLVIGETGTGKEMVVQEIIKKSKTKDKFITVNCSAIAPSLMESELFGHKKGAYTGADKERGGYLKMADGGALFLDEIGELPSNLQAKLLRTMETGEYYPVGGDKLEKVQVRLFAATNKPEGIRDDIKYRFPRRIEVEPLRQRRADIFAILYGLLKDSYSEEEDIQKNIQWLFYPWIFMGLTFSPLMGNVRELKNAVKNSKEDWKWQTDQPHFHGKYLPFFYEIPRDVSPFLSEPENLYSIWKCFSDVFRSTDEGKLDLPEFPQLEKGEFHEFVENYFKKNYALFGIASLLEIHLLCLRVKMIQEGLAFPSKTSIASALEKSFANQTFLWGDRDPELLCDIYLEYKRLGLEMPGLIVKETPSISDPEQPIGDLTGLTQDELLDCYYMQMLDKGWTQKRIAQAAGKSESAISDRMRKIKENSKNRI